jgi:hypothetical protein
MVKLIFALAVAASVWGQASKFEVASVKRCVEDSGGQAPAKGARGGGGSSGIRWSPGRLDVTCATLDNLIRDAYLSYPEGKQWVPASREEPTPDAFGLHSVGCFGCGRGVSPVSVRTFQQAIEGIPAWARSEQIGRASCRERV